ncbi:MAG TPA: chromosomal replication initiator protein DnaA [Rectinemataceae bacterium]|nr:chromosomal replication initiator protein DnaA [Rectinemataceae bacterium]
MAQWDYKVFWDEALSQIHEELGEHEFSMWFNLSYESATEDSILVRVPSSFYRDQVSRQYQSRIESKLLEVSGKSLSLEFIIIKPNPAIQEARPAPRNEGSETEIVPQKPVRSALPSKSKHPQLRLDYNFDSFVIGENNKFAANAAMAISMNPGLNYNPFLIYGGVGLGKTHLMQSIGNRIWIQNEKSKIICVSAEEFTNEFINSIHDKSASTQSFKNKYRFVDILLIDDIHFLQDKFGVQEELFHTFNALYDAGKQMVFTCDRPVSELKKLNDRLRSRFERGLNVDLQPPNYETRAAILKKKVETRKVHVPDAVIEVVAKNISTNVRDLEGALEKLIAYAELVHKDITLEVAQNQLKDIFSQAKHGNVTIDNILRVVSEHFKLSYMDLKGKKRTRNIAFPRQIAMYIAREITEYSTTELGFEFGGRDHTTVMHACQKIDERLKLDPNLESTIQTLVRQIKEVSSKA